jgi:hypothetical protein
MILTLNKIVIHRINNLKTRMEKKILNLSFKSFGCSIDSVLYLSILPWQEDMDEDYDMMES